MDPQLLEAIREGLEKGRLQARVSEHQAALMQKTMNDVLKEKGFAPLSLGLSRYAGTHKKRLAEEAGLLLNSVPNICLDLLETLPDGCRPSSVTGVLLRDDYNPLNAFRNEGKRTRLCVALYFVWEGEFYCTEPVTVADKGPVEYKNWYMNEFLAQVVDLNQFPLTMTDTHQVFVRLERVGGDHHDLWSYFYRMGAKGHRSAFCSTERSFSVTQLHTCKRLDLRELDQAGFYNQLWELMLPYSCTTTPTLHDTKGVIIILCNLLEAGFCSLPDELQRSKKDTEPIKSLTGKQAHIALTNLCMQAKDVQLQIALCMQALSYFKYQNISCHFHANGSCKKEFLFSLVLYHALIFSLEWVAAGVTMGKGYTYFHSMSHWFDPEDAVPVWASDEMGEQGNSTRKLSAGRVGSGKQFERGQHRFESARKKSFKKIPTPSQKEDDVPRIFAYSYLKICKRCFTRNNTWRTNLDYLVQRVKRCGFDGHVTTQEGTNDILFSADSNNHQCFKLCVCGKRKWDIPSRASEYISE